MRRLALLALLLLPLTLVAAPPPETVALDRANEALAGGEPARAARILRDALPRVTDPAGQARVRCLLGSAELSADQPGAAERALRDVPLDAVCGTRAAFLRADALVRQGRPADAAALYAELGATFLGDDRDGRTVEATLPVARKLLADPDAGGSTGRSLLGTLLSLRISAERAAALARELATDLRDRPDVGGRPRGGPACDALVAALTVAESREDRLLATEVCGDTDSRLILGGLPAEDPDATWARARLADERGATALRLASIARSPDPERSRALAAQLAAAGDLAALPLLEADASADALWTRAELLLAAARPDDGEAALRQHLQRFPTDPRRAEVAHRRAEVLLELGRAAAGRGEWEAALARFESALTDHPEDPLAAAAAYESGLALRALGRADDARRRWEEQLARFPGASEDAVAALARMKAFDQGDPEGALADLRTRGSVERSRLEEPGLWVESRGRAVRDPSVRVGARNLEQVEVRLHTIDLEAYVRGGGRPEDLGTLDVAAIAPERTFPVEVPDYAPYRDRVFEVPIPVGKPGLYAVTVASEEEEARALLLVSDLVVVARSVGSDLALATFDDRGRPVGGARVLVAGPAQDPIEGRTDGTGLWTGELVGEGWEGELVVLAEHRGSWAVTTLVPDPAVSAEPELIVLGEVDRPVVLPGDRIGVRAVARGADHEPVVGTWAVWLDGPIDTEPVELRSDERGVLVAELRVPDLGRLHFSRGMPYQTDWTVRAIPPGQAEPVQLAEFTSAPADPGGRTLEVRLDGTDLVATVRGPDGEPVAGVPLLARDSGSDSGADEHRARGRTDARGELRVAGPPAHLPWSGEVVIAAPAGPRSRFARTPPSLRLDLDVAQDVLRVGEAPEVRIAVRDHQGRPGRSPVSLVLYRRLSPVTASEPLPDPWVDEPRTGLEGPTRWTGSAPAEPMRAEEPVWSAAPTVDGDAPVALPELDPGDYRLVATLPEGTGSATTLLSVSDRALRLVGARDVGLGDRLSLAPDGGGALLTAEADRLLWAAVRPDRRDAAVEVDSRWDGEVVLAATAPDGRVRARRIEADPSLHVELELTPDGAGTRVKAVVRSAAGKPVAASVSLTAWDLRLASAVGEPQGIGWWGQLRGGGPAGALGADLRDGAWATPIAAELLAEVERERERARALEAISGGLLSDNALAEAMLGEVPLGGLGTSGYGSGGGGFGAKGEGGIGTVGGDPIVLGMQSAPLPGVRQRVLWVVGDTTRDGVITGRLEGPPGRYRVRATAVTAEGTGHTTAVADTAARPWLVVHAPEPGSPGDVAVPWVTVVNGTDRDLAGPLVIGDARIELAVAAGASTTVAVGEPLPPGPEAREVRWEVPGGAAASRWQFPLRAGSPDPEGPLVVRAGGVVPVALRPDPQALVEPQRAAVAGRAALAALAVSDDLALRDQVLAARDRLHEAGAPSDPTAAAVALLFLAEAASAGLVRPGWGELQDRADALPAPVTPTDRAWALRARAAAGLALDPNLVALVEQDAAAPDADPEIAAQLALATGSAARLDPASPFGAAALKARGRPVDAAALIARGAPDPGDRALPEWIAAVRDAPGGPGGGLRVEAAEGGALGPWSWRAAVPASAGEGPAAPVQRSPIGPDGRPLMGVDELGPCGPRPLAGLGSAAAAPEENPASPGGVAAAAAPPKPCVVAVGDSLRIQGLDLSAGLPGGLEVRWLDSARAMLQATAPGRYRVAGLRAGDQPAAPLVVEVVPGPAPEGLGPGARLALAEVAVAQGEEPDLPEGPLPAAQARRVAWLAFSAALNRGDDPAIAATFRTLAATDPHAQVDLDDVARAALALAATGDPQAAVRTWRAGLDAAFAAEAAGIGQLEHGAGALLAIQKVREAALRYPDGRRVGDALYLLPARLLQLADDGLLPQVEGAGITATDVRLTAAAWDREFLAAFPDHPLATAAGMRLARVLLGLGAADPAASWAARVAAANPGEPLSDGLTFLEALARTEAGDRAAAEPLLDRLARAPYADAEGTLGPSVHRADAELVLGRLYEARGQVARALAAYEEASPSRPEAARAAAALRASSLAAPGVVRVRPGQGATIPVEVTNVDEVRIRAYRVDLRTLFLRDHGLSGATDLAVGGVSPAWSGSRRVGAGSFTEHADVSLPLGGAGAWVVQLEGGGATASTLVVRSGLELGVVDAGQRRLTVRRGGEPAVGVEVRALAGGQVVRAVSDVRGVAEVPLGAPALAWSGEDWAFTDPAQAPPAGAPPPELTETAYEPLLKPLDERIRQRQAEDASRYDSALGSATGKLELEAL